MLETAAVREALDLLHLPTAVRRARNSPLPKGVENLLRIVVGAYDVENEIAMRTGRSAREIKAAAVFYIEQVLLHPEADSYRVLGVLPSATAPEIRRNMALLLRWLHPDVAKSPERRALIDRVTASWETIKTSERRGVYDADRRQHLGKTGAENGGRGGASGGKQRRAGRSTHDARPRISATPGAHVEAPESLLSRGWLFLFGKSRHR